MDGQQCAAGFWGNFWGDFFWAVVKADDIDEVVGEFPVFGEFGADDGVVGLEESAFAIEETFFGVGVFCPKLVDGVGVLAVDGELADVVEEAGGESEFWVCAGGAAGDFFGDLGDGHGVDPELAAVVAFAGTAGEEARPC